MPGHAMSAARSFQENVVLEIPSDLGAIHRAVDLVLARCATSAVEARRLRLNFRVGLSEALANAMLYGNRRDPRKRVRVEVTWDTYEIVARVTDEGEGFDPTVVPDPTMPETIELERGRGLFLMRKLLDEVVYNDRGNSVTLVLRSRGGGEEARL